MNKIKLALMVFSLAVLATGCAKEDEKLSVKNEIEISLAKVEDNTAVINCVYNPDKSEMYQLSLDETTYLNNRTKSGTFRIENLQSGRNYKVVARSYDADNNFVDSSELDFKTTGITMDMGMSIGASVWNEEEYNNCPIQVSVKKVTTGTVQVTCEFKASDLAAAYSLECINFFKGTPEGTFSETGTFGEGKKVLSLTGLQTGVGGYYQIYAYYYGSDGRRTGKYASFDFSFFR